MTDYRVRWHSLIVLGALQDCHTKIGIGKKTVSFTTYSLLAKSLRGDLPFTTTVFRENSHHSLHRTKYGSVYDHRPLSDRHLITMKYTTGQLPDESVYIQLTNESAHIQLTD